MDYHDKFSTALNVLPADDLAQLSMPFFTAKPEGFDQDRPTYLYVGQESFGWGEASAYLRYADPASEMQAEYLEFDLGSGARGMNSLLRTPFWSFHRKLAASLGIPYQNMIWSNLVRFDGYPRGTGRASLLHPRFPALDHLLDAQRGLLEREIAEYRVRGIVFLTGPLYDYVLKDQLEISEWGVAHRDIKERALSRLKLTAFPDLPVFRTYHPGYLRRGRLEAAVLPVLTDGLTVQP